MQDFSKEEIIENIERDYQVTTAKGNLFATQAPPFLGAKTTSSEML